MKRPLKIAFGLLLTIPFLMSLGCPGFQRSPCNYEDKEVKAYISNYEIQDDSTMIIWFKAVEEQKSWVWDADDENKTDIRIHSSQFEEYDLSIDTATIDDISILYLVEGTFILEGTCGPHTIFAIERLSDAVLEEEVDSTSQP